ncbi:DUF6473 family protein [Oceaniglobus roseus]|uniref:DUF6473 family protein n=1 Tax=Oceaniglobus roseus TaxID=1737570 RepID=UPI000C7EA4D3|nr:DUF6473 family protein [Kandeliimicrobium roseum]
MAYENMPGPAVDYAPCRYGTSRLVFRGPQQRLAGRYIAVLGGSETYGRYLADPYPALLQDATGVRTVNFGCVNAGVDAFVGDETVIDACRGAEAVILQIGGAANLSNRFYGVHPRRNDRVTTISPVMKAVFPEVDFTDFHFTRHMLGVLEETSASRFALLRDELRRVWLSRMNLLMSRIGRPVTLLWMAGRRPEDPAETLADGDPPYVGRAQIDALRGRIADEVRHVFCEKAGVGSPDGKLFNPEEEPAALTVAGPAAHEAVAEALVGALGRQHRKAG